LTKECLRTYVDAYLEKGESEGERAGGEKKGPKRSITDSDTSKICPEKNGIDSDEASSSFGEN
jgi:hypothetical protein